jgi:O-antigen/teichoic acid export membrane protein
MEDRLTSLAPAPNGQAVAVNRERLTAPASPSISIDVSPAFRAPVKRLPLRTNFVWTVAGNVTSAACAWLVVVAIIKLGSVEMAGYYALSQAIVVPILGFSMLQLRAIYATDAGNEYGFGQYVALRWATTALAFVAMAIAAFATMNGRTVQYLTLAVGFGAGIEALADVIYGGLQQRERMDCISLSMACRSTLALATAAIALWLTGNIVASLWAAGVVKGLVLLAVDIPLGMTVMGTVSSWNAVRGWLRQIAIEARNVAKIRNLAWHALPLGIVMLLLALQTSLPRYLIQTNLDSKQLGIFSAISYAAISGTIVISALAQSAAPRMAQHYLSRDAKSYYVLIAKLAAVGATFGLCGIFIAVQFGRPLLTVLYSADCAARNDVLIWLMVASGVNYVSTFFGWGMTAARQIRIQLPLFASVVAVMFAAGCVLVPRWGLTGAAMMVLVGALAQLAGTLFLVLRAIPAADRSSVCPALCQAEAQP